MSFSRKTYPGELYFVTLTVNGWIDFFSREEYAVELFKNLAYCQQYKELDIYAYCLMPSHLHMIAGTRGQMTLAEVLGHFKSYTAKVFLRMLKETTVESRKDWLLYLFEHHFPHAAGSQFHFWKPGIHPIVLYSAEVICQKENYIYTNPVVAGWVHRPEDWRYSSLSSDPLIPVLPL